MGHHRKAIALIFIFLLVGHDCARIQDYESASAANMRYKHNHTSGLGHGPVCPISDNLLAVQERYQVKVAKLLDAVQTMEGVEWTTTFMWKLQDIGLRLDRFESCVFAASTTPELLEPLLDSNTGLMPVMTNVMRRVAAQMRQRDLLNDLETPTCKLSVENISEQMLRKWRADSEVDTAKSTHALFFGADCDVYSYVSSLGLSASCQKDFSDLYPRLMMLANSSWQSGLQASKSALQKAREVLEGISVESYYGDAGTTLPKEHEHDGQDATLHEELHKAKQHRRLQQAPENSALIERDATPPTELAQWLDVLVYLAVVIGVFILIIALILSVNYGVRRFFKGIGKIPKKIFGSGMSKEEQEKAEEKSKTDDYNQRMITAQLTKIQKRLDDQTGSSKGSSKGSGKGSGRGYSMRRISSRRGRGSRFSSRRMSGRGNKR